MNAKPQLRFFNALIDVLFVKLFLVDFIIKSILISHQLQYSHNFIIHYRLIFTFFAYYFLCEFFFGRTLGKVLTGTKVISATAGVQTDPSIVQLLARTCVRFIPFFDALSFLIFGEGWHDTWSNTKVVAKNNF